MGFLLFFFIKPKNPTQPPRKLGFFPSLIDIHNCTLKHVFIELCSPFELNYLGTDNCTFLLGMFSQKVNACGWHH